MSVVEPSHGHFLLPKDCRVWHQLWNWACEASMGIYESSKINKYINKRVQCNCDSCWPLVGYKMYTGCICWSGCLSCEVVNFNFILNGIFFFNTHLIENNGISDHSKMFLECWKYCDKKLLAYCIMGFEFFSLCLSIFFLSFQLLFKIFFSPKVGKPLILN